MYTVGANVPEAVDKAFWFIIVISVILLLLVTSLMIFFAIKYNRKRHPKPQPVKQSMWLEIVWTLVPTILVLGMFYYGVEGFRVIRNVPKDAMIVKVYGRMWNWAFEYANGRRTDKLYVPKGKSVKLELLSLDVIHSLYIPAFRVKEDVVPGRKTYLWFKPQTTGPTDIFCAEFCGQRHAFMLSQVIVMEKAEFDKWYAEQDKPVDEMAELKKIPAVALMEDHGCLECHSIDASKGERIPLKGIFGKKRFVLNRDGSETEVVADEAYLRRSLLEPGAQVLKGQADSMEPVEDLTEEQLKMIIDFLETHK